MTCIALTGCVQHAQPVPLAAQAIELEPTPLFHLNYAITLQNHNDSVRAKASPDSPNMVPCVRPSL